MNVWYHQSTIIRHRHALRTAALITLCVALITTLFFANVSRAAPGINQTMSFQGRLLDASGDVVPDGTYNMQFKIYQDGTGTAAGNPDGTLKWTETYINNGGGGGVQIKNGYLSVNLGSQSSFGSSVDWNQDTLWLSMNVAGSSTSCSSFGTGPCVADGEMLPMKRLTTSPYAMNAGQLDGKSSNQFVQIGQGVQTDAGTNSSIYLNKTGSGNLLQLQNNAVDVLRVASTGDIIFGGNANHSIGVGSAAANVAGMQLTLSAGAGGSGTGSNGGTLALNGGAGGGTNGNGGSISIDAGPATGSGTRGSIQIGGTNAGSISIGSISASEQSISIGANTTGTSNVIIGSTGAAVGGTTTIQGKDGVTISPDGTNGITLSGTESVAYFGNGASSAAPNTYRIQGTNSSTNGVNGGNIVLAGGDGNGSGSDGLVILTTPTFSTTTNDANCYTSGASVATSCTVAASSVNSSAAIIVGFSTAGQTATLPDPSITTAGRIIYVMAAADSLDFTLAMNGGGTNNQITLHQNTAATVMWNGSDWIVAGTSSSSALSGTGETPNVQIGTGTGTGEPTLLTVDRGSAAPSIDDDALLGSMYYDTTIGKLQCYEADGWGACSSSPDNFVTLSPEYSNAVMNGTGVGTMNTDICSDTLDINDGTSLQPTICDENETYNFYNWNSTELTAQTNSIFVTYQLPSSFKEFVAGSTSLMGRTDSLDAGVEYQVYRNTEEGLEACGTPVSVAASPSAWQQANADPSSCEFAAGDSIVFKITMSAALNANAYVSNLNFAFSNK